MSEPQTANVEVLQEGAVLNLVLNRPERKNALSQAMYSALAEAIERAGDDSAVRVILIRGVGGCFTSGNDLEDFMNAPPAAEGNASPVARFMQALYLTPKPVVAAIQGPAVGIGTTLLLHCDLVYAGESAKLQMPFANLGLCPEYASSMLLPRMLGHARAAELLMLGEPFGAEQAVEYGIVNAVVADDKLPAHARERCERLAQQPPAAVRNTKLLMKEGLRDLGQQVMKREQAFFASGLQSEEFKEAVTAFFEKRKPDFSRFE